MTRRTLIKRCLIASPLALSAGTYGYGRLAERHAIEVVYLNVEIGMPRRLTVALLGDIHFDPLYEIDYLERVIDRVNRLSPELVLYAGDFVSKSSDRLSELVAILRKAKPSIGSFAVGGNHDHWLGVDTIASALRTGGITLLRNQ